MLIALGLTIFNAIEILRLERAGREARQTVARNNAQARDIREKARVIRQSINQTALQAVQASARDANALIDRRAFSWTALLNFFQATLPADVRIASVTPQVDDEGRMLVSIQVFARRAEDLSEFADALETTGAFSDVLPRQLAVEEDGTLRSQVQGYYAAGAPGRPPRLRRRQHRLSNRQRLKLARATRRRTEWRDEGALHARDGRAVVARHCRSPALADPVGIVLAINLVVLIAVVMPMRRSAESGTSQAEQSAAALNAAIADLKNAEATRDGQSQASKDLERFYGEVLPQNFASARRLTQLKLAQMARSHDVTLQSGNAVPEELRDSPLERLNVRFASPATGKTSGSLSTTSKPGRTSW